MKIQAVFFDGYGTLFEDAIARLRGFCAQIVREQGIGMTPEALYDVWDGAFQALTQGGAFVTLRAANRASLAGVFRDLGVDCDPGRYVDAIFEWFGQVSIYPDVGPTLAGLAGVMTGVVSNADADHLGAALERNSLRFPVVVSSESARCYKPEPGIFHEALETVGCRPETTLYVGDSQEDDIVGARRAGMPVAWLNRQGRALRPEIPKPDYEIASLREVLGIVKHSAD